VRDRAETATNREAQCDKSGNLEAETNWAPSAPWLRNVNQIDQSLTQHRPPYVGAFVGIELDPITVELDLVDSALAGKNLVDPRGFNEAGKGASVPIVPGFLRWKSTLFTLAGFALRLGLGLFRCPTSLRRRLTFAALQAGLQRRAKGEKYIISLTSEPALIGKEQERQSLALGFRQSLHQHQQSMR